MRALGAAAVLVVTCGTVTAQQLSVLDPVDDYVRVLEVYGLLAESTCCIRPGMTAGLRDVEDHPWSTVVSQYGAFKHAGIYDPELGLFYNSARPWRANDGALWQGRGPTADFFAGAYLEYRLFSASLRPRVFYSRNVGFDLSPSSVPIGMSHYALPRSGQQYLDFPQRFGSNPFVAVDWGESYARIDHWTLAVGLSHENLWWGPGLRNGLIMSGSGGGFPHAFVSLAEPTNIWIGSVQGRWLWGRLEESDFFDRNNGNDRRYITAIILSYAPRWISGLSIGGTRVFVGTVPETFGLDDVLLITDSFLKNRSRLHEDSRVDEYDQLASIFGRWVFPESGFEFYGEYAKGDHSANLRDLTLEPEHAQGYLLGFQKVAELRQEHLLRVYAEAVNLKSNRSTTARGLPTASYFYLHSKIKQGYTHRGQILGAGIGPGSDCQTLGFDLFGSWGSAGILFERVAHDADYYYRSYETRLNHMIELGVGLHGRVFVRSLEIGGGLALRHFWNEYYIRGNEVTNVNISLSIRYQLGQAR